MLGMIRCPMPITQPSLACLEGSYVLVNKHGLLLCIVQRINYYNNIYIPYMYMYIHTLLHVYDSTKRILGCVTVSRREHTIAQTRELEATKVVLPQVIEQIHTSTCTCTCDYVYVYK